MCCATHYNEPLLIGKYLVALNNALPYLTKVIFEVSLTIGTIDVVIVTDLLSEHDRRRTDGGTQDSIKKVRRVSYWSLTFIYMHLFSSFV